MAIKCFGFSNSTHWSYIFHTNFIVYSLVPKELNFWRIYRLSVMVYEIKGLLSFIVVPDQSTLDQLVRPTLMNKTGSIYIYCNHAMLCILLLLLSILVISICSSVHDSAVLNNKCMYPKGSYDLFLTCRWKRKNKLSAQIITIVILRSYFYIVRWPETYTYLSG
jgi:hypothetical protein